MELGNKNVEGESNILRDIIFNSASEVCGTVVIGRMTRDTWGKDEICIAVNAEKQAYLRMLNITGLSNDEGIRLENDYRDKNRKAKILVQESKDKIKAEEDKKMQNDFEGNKTLFWKWIKKIRKKSSRN